ncbi:hypothetical protein REPUB_Repub18cG0145300 [Reevesia pubescens]
MWASTRNSSPPTNKVLVVRQDLKMKSGKIASQCAHAATGMYAELMQRYVKSFYQTLNHVKTLQRQIPLKTMGGLWATQNSSYMQESTRNVSRNKLREAAENIGLPTFVVADAGRTQVSAGSKTVLAIGPGPKVAVDSVTGKLNLL